jgi:hypothetical protein
VSKQLSVFVSKAIAEIESEGRYTDIGHSNALSKASNTFDLSSRTRILPFFVGEVSSKKHAEDRQRFSGNDRLAISPFTGFRGGVSSTEVNQAHI